MNDQEAYDFYADPENLAIAGPARKHPKDQLTAILSVRISPSLRNQVIAAAASDGRSAGSWVRRELRAELQRRRAAAREREKPRGIIPDSGRRGESRALPSSLSKGVRRNHGHAATFTASGYGYTFSCPHWSVGSAVSASCEQCGPLEGAT